MATMRIEKLQESHDLPFIAGLIQKAEIAYLNVECPELGENLVETVSHSHKGDDGTYIVLQFILTDDELESLHLILQRGNPAGTEWFVPF